MERFNKKGQVAIFVIVAIVIVAILLVFLLYPKLKSQVSGVFIPQTYLKQCVEPVIAPALENITKQGGDLNPNSGYLVVNGTKVKYLCYTSKYYSTCQIQQPMIIKHVQDELYKAVQPKLLSCINSLKQEYEREGYTVSAGKADAHIEFVPSSIKITFDAPMTVTKEVSQTFKGFEVRVSSGMYDLLSITTSILEYESIYGDSETTVYMNYYPNLKIEKTKLSDGTKIYRLTDVITKEQFTFISRSLSWPPGYGTGV